MKSILSITKLFCAMCLTTISTAATVPKNTRGLKNVLFIISDDLRPDLGVYEGDFAATSVHPRIHTPNIDALAARSLLMRRAYVQYPLCNPSRSSMLTGRRPETLRVYDLETRFRDTTKAISVPQYFKKHGYYSAGFGKVYHDGMRDPDSWSTRAYSPPYDEQFYPNATDYSWAAINKTSISKHPLCDQRTLSRAKALLQEFAKPHGKHAGQPFFVAVGFRKPHAALVFPEEFLQFYPKEDIQLAAFRDLPRNLPPVAWNQRCSFFTKKDFPHYDLKGHRCPFNNTIADSKALEVRRAYYSTISYVDSLVGELLQELSDTGLSDDTVIVFVGDHGFHLGEHKQWCKRTNYEESVRVPALIHVPGLTDDGIITDKLTEVVDLFPTIVEAAGLKPVHLCPAERSASANTKACREGTSLMPLIEDPAREDWKQHAFSIVTRDAKELDAVNIPYTDVIGKSVRTMTNDLNMRYTEWLPLNVEENQVSWDEVIAAELYDLNKDPEQTENVVDESDYETIVMQMREYLRNEWRGALVENNHIGLNNDVTYEQLLNMKNEFVRNQEEETGDFIDILKYKTY